ncbi:CYFIP-related Rac1 interactor B [Microplitis demolitor]|uniref:CYFIP-related Rac1 interactor B n=1 Tax=Microplitis demolitor TaxID=69319 RepID=UPI0004CD3E8F|nr:CYFIP-related Rac1 interactor B [Microplitis demolitor]XP_053596825.1 CYFIP-related Rac1 interactor B [Microplitis demolitor]XP_053596826.1 CYFIP-related Rac1 interactor B [Microplitis demolitor]
MGKLLSLLARDESTCCAPQKYDVFLDFENAQPSENERDTFEAVQRVLKNSESILEEIQCYKGAGKEIREAISVPTQECQRKAYLTVVPLVAKLKRFYEFSLELERVVPEILGQLCSGNLSPMQHLETQQALVKQFAEILEFVFKFDEHKMKTPAIQNDFSYYRRTLTKAKDNPENELIVGNELANRMSLFYAHATPMLHVLSHATITFLMEREDIPRENITETLGTMAKVCLRMLENSNLLAQFQREETQLFVLRVMVGLVILYDHVHPQGVFFKGSNVDVKGCVKLLKDQPSCKSEGLLNALKYTTKHLNEENTPKNIKNLLAA